MTSAERQFRSSSQKPQENMRPLVNILGAGVSGLSLASHLKARNIPYHIYDGASKLKGYNYGITITASAYDDLLPQLDPKLDLKSFQKSVAVDRQVGGAGAVSVSSYDVLSGGGKEKTQECIKAQDSALRALLAQNHPISWSHRLDHVQSTPGGLQLCFEDGNTATAPITVDASGMQHTSVASLLLSEDKPEILPYAVYHGSRYVRNTEYEASYQNLFESDTNDRDWTLSFRPPSSSLSSSAQEPQPVKVYIQILRAYISYTDLPSPIQKANPNPEDPSKESEDKWVELRYTISRPALVQAQAQAQAQDQQTNQSDTIDNLFNPDRAKNQATKIPTEFHSELSELLQQNHTTIPEPLRRLLDPKSVSKDRLLNWLLRIRKLSPVDTKLLASKGVIVLGDAAFGLPVLGSRGACLAMMEGRLLANWLDEKKHNHDQNPSDDLNDFYTQSRLHAVWDDVEQACRNWLVEIHGQSSEYTQVNTHKDSKM